MTKTLNKLKFLIIISLFIFPSKVIAKEHLCIIVSNITVENMGQTVDHEIVRSEELKNPEHFIYFDTKKNEVTMFWEDYNKTKVRDVDNITKVDSNYYYGEYEGTDSKEYTTYHLLDDFSSGILSERGFISYFKCEDITLKSAEKKYDVPFSEFKTE